MNCASCGSLNREGRRFCSKCGAPLAKVCAACNAVNDNDESFCGQCGAALDGSVAERPRAGVAPAAADPLRTAERRHVTILFADLVGFTSLSDQRDAEDVRDLLGRYFETARTVITRYGGTIEKFIGDAVMAVWGARATQENDAELAVRAAMDLVDAVAVFGEEVGAPGLRARAGVLTGEAAVSVGAVGEGLVAGDLVNTASRVQSVAEPGTVYVGDVTREATEAAIVYEDAGTHQLRGKVEPLRLSFAAGDLDAVSAILDNLSKRYRRGLSLSLDAMVSLNRARLAIASGRHLEVAALLRDALDLFDSMKMPFWVAVTRLEHAEWLIMQGRSAEADDLLALASATFAELGVLPWHRRATQAAHDGPAVKEAPTAMPA